MLFRSNYCLPLGDCSKGTCANMFVFPAIPTPLISVIPNTAICNFLYCVPATYRQNQSSVLQSRPPLFCAHRGLVSIVSLSVFQPTLSPRSLSELQPLLLTGNLLSDLIRRACTYEVRTTRFTSPEFPMPMAHPIHPSPRLPPLVACSAASHCSPLSLLPSVSAPRGGSNAQCAMECGPRSASTSPHRCSLTVLQCPIGLLTLE